MYRKPIPAPEKIGNLTYAQPAICDIITKKEALLWKN